jgi:hypothetical protein
MNDKKIGERKPKESSFVTGQEALIYEIVNMPNACG